MKFNKASAGQFVDIGDQIITTTGLHTVIMKIFGNNLLIKHGFYIDLEDIKVIVKIGAV